MSAIWSQKLDAQERIIKFLMELYDKEDDSKKRLDYRQMISNTISFMSLKEMLEWEETLKERAKKNA